MPKTVAVTGASGFLGAAVCRVLVERGYRTIGMSRAGSLHEPPDDLLANVELRAGDVLDSNSLEAALQGADAVVHCAAVVSIDHTNGHRTESVNLEGTRNVLQACRNVGIRRLIHVSSVHAFTQMRGTRLSRSSHLADKVSLPYSHSKAIAHREIAEAMEQGLIDGCIVCPGGIVGPGDRKPSPVGRLVLDIARRKMPLLVSEGYWWCDVRDVAESLASAVDGSSNGEVYFTLGRYAKFADLARLCSKSLGRDVSRPAVPYWLAVAGVPPIKVYSAIRGTSPLYTRESLELARNCPDSVDDDSARRDLGYSPRPLGESIGDALAWFRDNGALA